MTPPDPDLDALRRHLAHLRAARGWSYDKLAARSGLARRTLIDIEQGRTTGSLKTWHALAHTLNTPSKTSSAHCAEDTTHQRRTTDNTPTPKPSPHSRRPHRHPAPTRPTTP